MRSFHLPAPTHWNYRTFLFEDVLQRYFEYLGYRVTRLTTLTDVEDKGIAEAKKEQISVKELTARNQTILLRDFEFLRINVPQYMIRGSTAVDQAASIVKTLVEKGYAYWHMHENVRNAYFDLLKFTGFGKLSKLDIGQWPKRKRRFHKDTYPGTPWNRGISSSGMAAKKKMFAGKRKSARVDPHGTFKMLQL